MRRDGKAPLVITRDANPKRKDWADRIAKEAALAMGGRPLLDCTLVATFMFVHPRPKDHYRANGALKESAPTHKSTRPDLGKLIRAAEDAMTGIVYRDDALIVREVNEKPYGEPARVEITIEEAP